MELAFPNSNRIQRVGFADPERVFLATYDGTVVIWDLATGGEIHRLVTQKKLSSAALSRDGVIATSGSKGIELWDAATGARRKLKKKLAIDTCMLVFSDDGKALLTHAHSIDLETQAICEAGEPARVAAFDHATGRALTLVYVDERPTYKIVDGAGAVVLETPGDNSPPSQVVFLGDGLAGELYEDGRTRIVRWNLAGTRVANTLLPEGEGTTLALSPDANLALWASYRDKHTVLFDVATATSRLLGANADRGRFSRDGSRFVLATSAGLTVLPTG